MAKKNLLAANLKRPSLKRTVKVTEETMDEVVQKVADNPPAREKPVAKAETIPAPPTTTAPAAAPKKTAPAATPRKGRGRPRKSEASALSTRSVYPKEGTKRLTLDIPKELHLKLKYLALEQETTMKDYIIEVVARSLK
ncbi:hypothetical protein [Neolewinella persica]|uniref:hypothetical protein n=1 Tax=Neolewinella persica TaxID=70998 RepID=UPI0003823BAD|nr:hypothetical protein [Neolewinella persica]